MSIMKGYLHMKSVPRMKFCKYVYHVLYILILITFCLTILIMLTAETNPQVRQSCVFIEEFTNTEEVEEVTLVTHIEENTHEKTQVGMRLDINKVQSLVDGYQRPGDEHYNINVTESDKTSVKRNIADTRPVTCRTKNYIQAHNLNTSVIIPFYNEALSALIRTIVSVLVRTPPHLLKEIILIDDKSSFKYLDVRLDHIVASLPKVRLVRNKRREGLIRSRLIGAELSQGEVLVFLDAHTECNTGWLEPILDQIQINKQTVVQPFVDGINIETLEYAAPKHIHKSGFAWDLRFIWMEMPDYMEKSVLELGQPFWSPTLIGCAMAIHKSYFNSIGSFDEGLNFWGGENLELAFRVWMCGGTVITLPCSRVGHYFREIPYKSEDWIKSWQKNLIRIAEVWMGEYKKYYYASTRIYDFWRVELPKKEIISLNKRKTLRDKLRCKDFEWYLTNVAPEIPIPPKDSEFFGEIFNLHSSGCWELYDGGYVGLTFRCYGHKMIYSNFFSLNKDGSLTYKNSCVMPVYPTPLLKVVDCAETTNCSWRFKLHDVNNGELIVRLKTKNKTIDFCLWQVTSVVEPHDGKQMPQVIECSDQVLAHNAFARWYFTYRFDFEV